MDINERFRITEMYICPFEKENNILIPDLSYPMRICVIDKEKKIAVDIEHHLSYDYIETINGIYFNVESQNRIELGKRVAIFPTVLFGIDESLLKKCKSIILDLKNDKEFKNGNLVCDNDTYLMFIDMDKNKQKKKSSIAGKILKKMKKK